MTSYSKEAAPTRYRGAHRPSMHFSDLARILLDNRQTRRDLHPPLYRSACTRLFQNAKKSFVRAHFLA